MREEMETKFKDVSHLYVGCKALYYNEGFNYKPIESKIALVDVRREQIELFNYRAIPFKGANYLKPILRRLTDMDYSEAFDFALMCMNSRHHLDEESQVTEDEMSAIDLSKNDGGNLLDADVEVYIGVSVRCFEGGVILRKDGSISVQAEGEETEQRVDDIAEKVVFLLKNHFDLFNLIESGQAIDAATLPVNPCTNHQL
jgi:hypothetical protein